MLRRIYMYIILIIFEYPLFAQPDYQLLDDLLSKDTLLSKSSDINFELENYLKKLNTHKLGFDNELSNYFYNKALVFINSDDENIKSYGFFTLMRVISNTNNEASRRATLKTFVTSFRYDLKKIYRQIFLFDIPIKYFSDNEKDSLRAYFKLPDSLFAKREIFYGKIGLAYLMADLGMTDQIPEVRAFVQRNDSLFQAKKRKSRSNYFDDEIDGDFYLHLTLAKFLVPEEIDYCIAAVKSHILTFKLTPISYDYLFDWLTQVKHTKVIDFFEEELSNKDSYGNGTSNFVWPFAYTIASRYLPKIIKDFPKPDNKQINFYLSEKNTLGYMKKFIKECQEWLKVNKDTLEILK